MSQTPNKEDANTQSSSIIRQLQENKPGIEKSREVVIDKNGQKVIRVTKKRRVAMTEEEQQHKKRHSLKKFSIFSALSVIILIAAGILFFMVRASSMSSPSYAAAKQSELSQAWGADVKIDGLSIENFQMRVVSLTATFPENSNIEKIELRGVRGDIGLRSYINGVLAGDILNVDYAKITLRDTTSAIRIPRFEGEQMWEFKRISCKEFIVGFTGNKAPFTLKSSAYMYPSSPGNHTLYLGQDTERPSELTLRGWETPITAMKGAIQISRTGLSHISLSGDIGTNASISLDGDAMEGTSPQGNLNIESSGVALSLLTNKNISGFLDAQTRKDPMSLNKTAVKAQFKLPYGDLQQPEVTGELPLRNIRLSKLPAFAYLINSLPKDKVDKYISPTFSQGNITLTHMPDGGTKIDLVNLNEFTVFEAKGSIIIGTDNSLSGNLSLGVPTRITSQKYTDQIPDPIFDDDHRTSWLNISLKGTVETPGDNADELEAKAAELRKMRGTDEAPITPTLPGTQTTDGGNLPASPSSAFPSLHDPVQTDAPDVRQFENTLNIN